MADPELPDDKMITDNGLKKNPFPAAVILALIAVFAALVWGGMSWFAEKQQTNVSANPFLQVTNREYSIFLWQFTDYMRKNVGGRSGYLSGFQYDNNIIMEAGQEESPVSAPPEALFMYHTWKRLISSEFPKRPISSRDFKEFLEIYPEWQPDHWKSAPEEYITLVKNLPSKKTPLPLEKIPNEVQRAFIGWKNFFLEGDLIVKYQPTFEELQNFLEKYPHYARNYWRNLVMKGKPNYLKNVSYDSDKKVPDSELVPFLKVALFNESQANKDL